MLDEFRIFAAGFPYYSGYLSEPEPGAYDSDAMSDYKYATLDRRRPPPKSYESDYHSSTVPRNTSVK